MTHLQIDFVWKFECMKLLESTTYQKMKLENSIFQFKIMGARGKE